MSENERELDLDPMTLIVDLDLDILKIAKLDCLSIDGRPHANVFSYAPLILSFAPVSGDARNFHWGGYSPWGLRE